MTIVNIIFIAVALAMDAFAVAIAVGVGLQCVTPRQRFRLSWHFGLFQGIMPIIGWYSGNTVRGMIDQYDHWIAFGLLSIIGLNMIKEFFTHEETVCRKNDPTRGRTLIMLSITTSIDALAVGVSMSMLHVTIFFPALIIGLTAAAFTLTGLEIGARFSRQSRLSPLAQLIGGGVLLLIGVNILTEHHVLMNARDLAVMIVSMF